MYRAISVPRHEPANELEQFVVRIADDCRPAAALREDIERLGGVAADDGFRFHTRRGRNMAARILEQRWGSEAIETADLSGPENHGLSLHQKSARVLLVSLGDANTANWFRFLTAHEIIAERSTDGMQCSVVLKEFQPNVLLIDESLLWGPRQSAHGAADYPPMRVAFLSDDGWPMRSSLKPATGGSLPAVAQPAELLELLREFYFLD